MRINESPVGYAGRLYTSEIASDLMELPHGYSGVLQDPDCNTRPDPPFATVRVDL